MGAIFGPLAAILIGAEAGAGDVAVGVFRDLVATGRSRLALFATRVPAAIALSWIVTGAAYVLLVIGVYALAAGSATPSASEMLDGVGFSLLSTGVICAIAVGLGAVSPSRPATPDRADRLAADRKPDPREHQLTGQLFLLPVDAILCPFCRGLRARR